MRLSTQQLLEICHIIRQEFGGDFFENNVWFISADMNVTLQNEFGFNEPILNNSGKEIKVYAGIWLYFPDYDDYEHFEGILRKSNITRSIKPFLYFNPFGSIDDGAVLVAISI